MKDIQDSVKMNDSVLETPKIILDMSVFSNRFMRELLLNPVRRFTDRCLFIPYWSVVAVGRSFCYAKKDEPTISRDWWRRYWNQLNCRYANSQIEGLDEIYPEKSAGDWSDCDINVALSKKTGIKAVVFDSSTCVLDVRGLSIVNYISIDDFLLNCLKIGSKEGLGIVMNYLNHSRYSPMKMSCFIDYMEKNGCRRFAECIKYFYMN